MLLHLFIFVFFLLLSFIILYFVYLVHISYLFLFILFYVFPLLCFCGYYFFPIYSFNILFPDRCFSSNLYPTTLFKYPISYSRFPIHSLGFLSRHNDNFVSSYILSHAVMLPIDFHEGVE